MSLISGYRSQIQSRDSRADVSHARGIPQSSAPKCEVDSREHRSGLPDTARKDLSFFFFFSRSLRTCGETEAGWRPRPARLHKYYANIRSGRVTSCARTRETVTSFPPFPAPRALLRHSQKCRCLFPPRYARLACLPYRPEIAGTLHTQHNSTPNLLPPAPSASFLSAVYYSPYRTLSHPSPPLRRVASFRVVSSSFALSHSRRATPLRLLLVYDDLTSSFLRSSIYG